MYTYNTHKANTLCRTLYFIFPRKRILTNTPTLKQNSTLFSKTTLVGGVDAINRLFNVGFRDAYITGLGLDSS